MNVLVTGGAGYVGSVLVPKLLEKGYKVRVVDNMMYGVPSLLPCFINPNFEFIRGDVRDEKVMREALEGADVIIHLAAIVGAPACQRDEKLAWEVNYEATALLDELRDKDQTVIFASTGSVYGKVDGICTEETPINPLSTYGVTKARAEERLLSSGNVIVYRFATAFGLSPRLRLDLLPNDFTFQAVKNRSLIVYERHFRRTFIHVTDMARAFLFALENMDKMRDEVYNVGNESMNYTKEEVALKIKEKVDFYLYFADIGSDPDKRDYEVSYEKIRRLGFETKVTMDQGIDELIRGFQMLTLRTPYRNVEE